MRDGTRREEMREESGVEGVGRELEKWRVTGISKRGMNEVVEGELLDISGGIRSLKGGAAG